MGETVLEDELRPAVPEHDSAADGLIVKDVAGATQRDVIDAMEELARA